MAHSAHLLTLWTTVHSERTVTGLCANSVLRDEKTSLPEQSQGKNRKK